MPRLLNHKVFIIGAPGCGKTAVRTRLSHMQFDKFFLKTYYPTIGLAWDELPIHFNEDIRIDFHLWEVGAAEGCTPLPPYLENADIILFVVACFSKQEE